MNKHLLLLTLLLTLLLSVGCISTEQKENVKASAYLNGFNLSEFWDNKTNTTISRFAFNITSNSSNMISCSVEISYSNFTVENKTIKYIGFLNAYENKRSFLFFEMPQGNTTFHMKPICK
jgi:hypothetical protein